MKLVRVKVNSKSKQRNLDTLFDLSQPSVIVFGIMGGAGGLALLMVITKALQDKMNNPASLEADAMPRPDKNTDSNTAFLTLINQGNAAMAKLDYDGALSHFQEALKIKSTEAPLHFKIGRLFIQKQDYRNAMLAFGNALAINPNLIEANFELARIFQLQKNLEQAHLELDQALSVRPDHEETLKYKVKLLEQEGRYEEAIPYLQKLIETAPSISVEKHQLTLADFRCKLGQSEEAINDYSRLMEKNPDNRLQYLGKMGQVYFDQQEYAQAIECFQTLLNEQEIVKDPEFTEGIRSQLGASLCNLGVQCFEDNDFQQAIDYYIEALEYDESNPDIHYNLGKALTRLNEHAQALEHLQIAIDLNPEDVASYYEMAVVQDNNGMIDEAVQSYHKVLDLEPRNLNATFGLGTLFGIKGDMEKAIQYLSAAVAINPEFVDGIYNLGVALEQKQDYKKAGKMYQKVLELDPHHQKASSNLAHVQHIAQQG
jgi:tetratricopeptide (TPR) repeat protein